MAGRAPNDFTVTRCRVCGGTDFRRYGTCVGEPNDPIATEFADCLGCGETYLYKRPAPAAPSCDSGGGSDV